MAYKINHADILDWAKNYDGPLFDGILCDPPYELGFMGKSWDSTGIAFNVELWTELLRILKPGAHLLAFSGSRTYHRMACAIEDAGFEIRDMIEWVYGSGFPKSLNIGKAVDKIQGNERKVVGKTVRGNAPSIMGKSDPNSPNYDGTTLGVGVTVHTKGTSDWEGYGTALKPAHEPCVLARKPIKGTVANNCLEHGTGGLNIDESRVDYVNDKDGGDWDRFIGAQPSGGDFQKVSTNKDKINQAVRVDNGKQSGRFPANLIHDGSDEVLEVFPQTKGEIHNKLSTGESMFMGDGVAGSKRGYSIKDSGSASRFFYTAKASKSERNAGLEGFEERKSSKMGDGIRSNVGNGTPGNTESADRKAQNHHPTVKPLSLTKYLATLIKPPTGGRLLVPFSGSGSEMIGALQAGWEHVEGVELTEEYIPIAEARIKYWLDKIDKQLEIL